MLNNISSVAEILEWINGEEIRISIFILKLGFILLNKILSLLLELVQKILTLCLQFCINTLLEKFRRQVGILLFKLISNLGLQLAVNLILRPFFSFGKVHGLKPKHKTYLFVKQFEVLQICTIQKHEFVKQTFVEGVFY